MSFEEELLSDMRVYKSIEANWFIFKAKIEEYCLDKARVREAIESSSMPSILRNELYRKLGLSQKEVIKKGDKK